MTTSDPKPAVFNKTRWFHPTPGRLLAVLLAVLAVLLLSNGFLRFVPIQKMGWIVLITFAVLAVYMPFKIRWLHTS